MTDEKTTRTELSELGEFGLIDRLTADVHIKNASTIKGIGDDAAVIDNKDFQTLISTDLLIEKVHFDMTYYPLKHLGYKAAVVNFSDIYAMNGTPEQLIVALAVSNRFSVEALEEIYSGIKLACEKYGVDLVGGDTTTSYSGLILSLTAIGKAPKDKIVFRNGAREYDLICVSGDLGAAYAGLLILEREKTVFLANPNMQPELEDFEYVVGRQLKPEARKNIISLLAANDIQPTAMIDISDGLASELLHICKNSDTGCAVYEEKIPIHVNTAKACETFNIDPITAAMNGGEDYELLFTIKQKDYEKIKNLHDISIIGHITDKNSGYQLITRSGQSVSIQAQGWDALRKKD